MNPEPDRRLPSPLGLLPWLALFVLLLAPAGRADEPGRDVEPAPPWIFFPAPDPVTGKEISDLVDNSFGDLNKVVVARDLLVHRYGLWSAAKMELELRQETNETVTWNAALTAYALRDALGNAPELWVLPPPLVRLVETSAEPYRRAFAALALGSFHGPEFLPPPPARTDPLAPRRTEEEARRALDRILDALGNRVDDGHPHVEVAAALALAKSGAAGARARLRASERISPVSLGRSSAVEPRMAVLLAMGLLPDEEDEALFIQQLRDEDRRIRRAAALGAALQAFLDPPPTWVASPHRLLRALTGADIRMDKEDGAEAVFARGVFAARGLAPDEWRDILELAIRPSSEKIVKRAAAQCLLFCESPSYPQVAYESAKAGPTLDPIVLASFLLHLGSLGTAEGVEVCEGYLRQPSRTPRGKPEWDVRYHAALGLLRALAAGRIEDPALRTRVVEALDQGATRALPRGAFRDALGLILDQERRSILENPAYVLPDRRLAELAGTFVDEAGLLSRGLADIAIVRLNDMMPIVFNVNNLPPGTPGNRDKSEAPRRFLQACYRDYPYFSRLDLRLDRGRRPWPQMTRSDDPRLEVQRR